MKPKYLYIDDEDRGALESFVRGFTDTGLIGIEIFPLDQFHSFEQVKIELKRNDFDGLIVDLRLDGTGPNRVEFTATTLAQDFRTSAASNEFKSFPIILCSTDAKMRATYDSDKTSHDLFDFKFEKSAPDYEKFSRKFKDLAEGYAWLNEKNNELNEIFGRVDLENLDDRILERFDDKSAKSYEYAQFVIKELFHHPGPLIKERVLAARLGIDIEESAENWDKLKNEIFNKSMYTGLFSFGWERWWADLVITQFKDFSPLRLAMLNAEERVKILIDSTGIRGLIPAKPITLCNSTEFWTICEGYKKPLDPLEGFKVFESVDLKPWQESKYISFQASEVERIGRDRGLKPHPSEKERIIRLKQSLDQ